MSGKQGENNVHLVLAAGGARCLSYVGAVAALEERGISFASVSACSAGTLIGALLCAGITGSELEEKILSTDLSRLAGEPILPRPFHCLGLLKWPFAMYRKPGFQAFFQELLDGLDPLFKDLQIPLSIAGLDIATDRILVYSKDQHEDMRVSEAIQIATAVPTMYPPHRDKTGKRIVVDAAVVTQCPVWIAAGHDDPLPILALTAAPPRPSTRTPRSFLHFIIDVFVSDVFSRDHYYMQQLPRVRPIEIDCRDIAFNQFDLSMKQKRELLNKGRNKAEELLQRMGDDLWDTNPPPLMLQRKPTPEDLAEQQAAKLITGFQRKLPKLMREQVFISYSHEDAPWLELLKAKLRTFTRARSLLVWDDTLIRPGERWKDEIRRALASAKVAVFMVSRNFLSSRFITEEERSYLVWASQQEGVRIIWFTLDICDYEPEKLNDLQAAWDPARPLGGLSSEERDAAMAKIAEAIARALGSDSKESSQESSNPEGA